MTETKAREILSEYQEEDEETGEMYGFDIIDFVGADGDGLIARCIAEGATYHSDEELPLYAIYPDGTVLCVPA